MGLIHDFPTFKRVHKNFIVPSDLTFCFFVVSTVDVIVVVLVVVEVRVWSFNVETFVPNYNI